MFYTPYGKEAHEQVLDYIFDIGEVNQVYLYIDIQNIMAFRYSEEAAETAVIREDAHNLVIQQLLAIIQRMIKLFADKNIECKIVIYLDSGRNLVNENFIPHWKECRTKQLALEDERRIREATFQRLSHKLGTITTKAAGILLNTTRNIRFINLEYIDSDFIPMLNYYISQHLEADKRILHLIISNDTDYVHMLNEDELICRYYFLRTGKVPRRLDHKYNIFERIKYRYNISFDEAKKITNLYQVFHVLTGDSSDNVPSLVKGKGPKYWLKSFFSNCQFSIPEIRRKSIVNECFIDGLSELHYKWSTKKEETCWSIFKKRLAIFDFWFFSSWLLPGIIGKEIVEDEDIILAESWIDTQLPNLQHAKERNIQICKELLTDWSPKLSIPEATNVMNHFNIRNIDPALLW